MSSPRNLSNKGKPGDRSDCKCRALNDGRSSTSGVLHSIANAFGKKSDWSHRRVRIRPCGRAHAYDMVKSIIIIITIIIRSRIGFNRSIFKGSV